MSIWASHDPGTPAMDRAAPDRPVQVFVTVPQPPAAEIATAPEGVPALAGSLPREPRAYQPRPDLVAEIGRIVETGRHAVVCALAGARGVGKTQLAAAYARECLDNYLPTYALVGRLAPAEGRALSTRTRQTRESLARLLERKNA